MRKTRAEVLKERKERIENTDYSDLVDEIQEILDKESPAPLVSQDSLLRQALGHIFWMASDYDEHMVTPHLDGAMIFFDKLRQGKCMHFVEEPDGEWALCPNWKEGNTSFCQEHNDWYKKEAEKKENDTH